MIEAFGSDRWLMRQALVAARWGLGRCAPNPSVGAAIFSPQSGILLGRGTTQPGGRPHAEPVALAMAGDAARGATMAVTLEPCSHYGRSPPCVNAITKAGIARVLYAVVDPDPRVAGRGLDVLTDAGLAVDACDADLAEEARWITRGHILRVTERRPFVQLKLAVGADGRIAEGGNGQPSWVTGPLARNRGHLMRAQADAILIGTGTATTDQPSLTTRLPGLHVWSPIRVVVGRRARETALAGARADSDPLVWTAGPSIDNAHAVASADTSGHIGVQLVGGHVWLPDLMENLVARDITRLLVEGGPVMWRAFATAQLVDEVVLFHAREDRSMPTSEAQAIQALSHYIPDIGLRLAERRAVGGDDMLIYRVPEARGWQSAAKS